MYYNNSKKNLPKITATKVKSRIIFKKEDGTRAEFDLGTKKFYKTTKTKKELYEVSNIKPFFTYYSFADILNGFEDDNYRNFVNSIQRCESRCTNMGTILLRLSDYAHLEQYHALGIEIETGYSYGYYGRNTNIIQQPLSFYSKPIRKMLVNRELIVNKTLESRFKKYGDTLETLILYFKNSDDYSWGEWSNFLLRSYSKIDIFMELVNDYNYDYKRLISYLKEIEMFENFNKNYSVTSLRDYARMSTVIKNNGKFEKYPRYLKTIHDITMKNYNFIKQQYNEELFKTAIENYSDLEYTDGNFTVTTPKISDDMKHEGVNLNHCVASYVDNVIDRKTKILFVRRKENQSLVTIEVKHGKITQARGYHNRAVNQEEEQFLQKYAKAKNLIYK